MTKIRYYHDFSREIGRDDHMKQASKWRWSEINMASQKIRELGKVSFGTFDESPINLNRAADGLNIAKKLNMAIEDERTLQKWIRLMDNFGNHDKHVVNKFFNSKDETTCVQRHFCFAFCNALFIWIWVFLFILPTIVWAGVEHF